MFKSLLSMFLTLLPSLLIAQEKPDLRATVKLTVQAPSEFQSRIHSALLTALRKHPEVQIANDDIEDIYQLNVVCLENTIVLACSVIGSRRQLSLTNDCAKAMNTEFSKVLGRDSEAKVIQLHMVQSWPKVEIDGLIQSLVAAFDTDVLEKWRQFKEKAELTGRKND